MQDILSGKLGTRRAAVLYGIPRSTLRNKVYKLAMEQKREASMSLQSNVLDDEDDDKESGAEDDKDIEKAIASSVLAHNMSRILPSASSSSSGTVMMQKFGNLYENNVCKMEPSAKDKPKSQMISQPLQTPPIVSNPWLDPVMLQNLILAGGLMQQKYDDPAFQELFRNLLIQQQELMKDQQIKKSTTPNSNDQQSNNGKPNSVPDARNILHNLSLIQHQHAQQQQQPQSQHHHQNRLNAETPDTASSVDISDANEDAAVILKIPSFKPVAGSSSSCKNGDNLSDTTPRNTPPMMSRSPHSIHLPGLSPPIAPSSTDSQSPPMKNMLSLRDVIAKSITKTFNQQSPEPRPSIDQHEQYKRPSISVIKNLGGTDMSRFASSPNMMGSHSSNNSNTQSSMGGAGGKGTRPKRGKYRNYDRDSLVEAVKAVQRGEMSVHRAGSYYGVPHSTLEYKVKERHLMRPRKREPKPQPLDGTPSSSSANNKADEIPGQAAANLRSLDKSKPQSTIKPPLKTPPFSDTSPNGLKMGMFDPTHMQYASQLFWPHAPGYAPIPLDFARVPSGTPTSFLSGSENIFTTHMMQRMQEDAIRQAGVSNSSGSSSGTSMPSAATPATPNNSQSKPMREIAESLYDGTSANGSLLDGIIRHSLDRKAGDIPHGALLDQLVKNNIRHTDDSVSNKRSGSPINFAQSEIKRERTSPSSVDTDRDFNERDLSKESDSIIKYRDNYALRLDEKCLRDSMEDLNGDSPDDKLTHTTDNEDSS